MGAAGGIDDAPIGVGVDDESVAAVDGLVEEAADASGLAGLAGDEEGIAEAGLRQVVDIEVVDENEVALCEHTFVVEMDLAEEGEAAEFEVIDEDGVVDVAISVALIGADVEGEAVMHGGGVGDGGER